jgi:hypothetical protein
MLNQLLTAMMSHSFFFRTAGALLFSFIEGEKTLQAKRQILSESHQPGHL